MWEYNQSISSDKLYHHGILGMKWGVRRYQNKDGSLTVAGRKKQSKKDKKLAKKRIKAQEKVEKEAKKKPRTVKDMTDDELRSKINRLQMEKQYLDLNQQVSSLEPKPISTGQKIIKNLNDTLIPAAKNAGKNLTQQYLEKKGKELLGLNTKDPVETLKREAQSLNYKKQINEAKKYFANEKKANNGSKPSNSDFKKATESTDNFSQNTSKKKTHREKPPTIIIEGVGTSKGTQSQKSKDRGPVKDAIYTEITPNNPHTDSTIKLGQRRVAGLLEDKH